MHERISIDPNICHGEACIRGTRLPVHQIVHMLANGDSIDDLIQDFPSLSRDDVLAALDYAASPRHRSDNLPLQTCPRSLNQA